MPTVPPYLAASGLLVFAWVSNYFVRMALPALLPPIMRELGLSYTSAGILATAFFYAYAAMQVPAGLLGDRFGRRRVLVIGLVLGAGASLATGFAASLAALAAARLLTGVAQGCLFSNDRPIIAAVTPPDKIARGQALSFIGPGVGITAGFVLAGALGDVLPWRGVFLLFALPPLLAAALIVRYVPAPPTHRDAGHAGIRRVLRSRDLWWLAGGGATAMWLQFMLATWAPMLFLERGVRDLSRAGLYASLQGVAAVAGLIAGGWAGDAARRRHLAQKVVVAGSLAGAALAVAALGLVIQRGGSPAALAVTVLLTSFFAWSMWAPSFVVLGAIFPGADASTAFGVYNTICVVGAVVGPGVTGILRDTTGSFAAGAYVAAGVAIAGAAAALTVAPAFRMFVPGRQR